MGWEAISKENFKTFCLAEKENIVMKHVEMQVIEHCRATCDEGINNEEFVSSAHEVARENHWT